jgi:hypothetical protein
MTHLVRVVAVLLLWTGSAAAESSVRIETASPTAVLGSSFDVRIVVDLSLPVVGWGLDLGFDPAILSLDAAPIIGPDWVGVFAPDGDGLSGLTPSVGISGTDILLATLSFTADSLGTSALLLSVTAGALTEGFALDPSGFDSIVFTNGLVEVVPEPATGLLFAGALVALGLIGRARS